MKFKGRDRDSDDDVICVSRIQLTAAIIREVRDAFPHPFGFRSEVPEFEARSIAESAIARALRLPDEQRQDEPETTTHAIRIISDGSLNGTEVDGHGFAAKFGIKAVRWKWTEAHAPHLVISVHAQGLEIEIAAPNDWINLMCPGDHDGRDVVATNSDKRLIERTLITRDGGSIAFVTLFPPHRDI